MMVSSTKWGSKSGELDFVESSSLNSFEDATGRAVAVGDYPALEQLVNGAIKEKQPFERLIVSKENLLKMFEVSDSQPE